MPADSFSAAPVAVVATTIQKVQITLTVTDAIPAQGGDPATPRSYAGRYTFDRLSAGGVVVDTREGSLVPHLTAQQITQIKAFLDALLTKAQGSVG